MGTRGRKSGAELAIAAGPLTRVERPDAPYDLTDEESREWWAIVNDLPADWFPRHTQGLLAQYCRHIVNARRIAQLVEAALKGEKIDTVAYDKLLAMQDREGRAIGALATRMRISQQSSTRVETVKKPRQVEKPWES